MRVHFVIQTYCSPWRWLIILSYSIIIFAVDLRSIRPSSIIQYHPVSSNIIQYHPVSSSIVSSSILYRKTPALPALPALVLLCPVEVIPWKAWAAWWAAPRRPTSEILQRRVWQRWQQGIGISWELLISFWRDSSASCKCTENTWKPTKFHQIPKTKLKTSEFFRFLRGLGGG